MKKCFFVLLCMVAFFARGQNIKSADSSIHFSSDLLVDSSKSDFSFLDRIFLKAKAINPNSSVFQKKDTLFIQFDLPRWVRLRDNNLLMEYANTYFDAFFTGVEKDSVKFKMVGIQICQDSFECATSWYEMEGYNYKRRFSLLEKLQYFTQANFWHNEMFESEIFNGKKAMVLYYFIDTTLIYSKPDCILSFFQSASSVIGDLVYKSKLEISNQYEDLITLFTCKGHLLYYWRFSFNKEQLLPLYKIKFYESGLKQMGLNGANPILWNPTTIINISESNPLRKL